MKNLINRLFSLKTYNKWFLFPVLLALLMGLPVYVVLSYLFLPGTEAWSHILHNHLFTYLLNTVALMAGVAVITVLLGVVLAWLVTLYEFPGSKIFEWALILPLALPAYIAAFTYAGMLSFTGPLYTFFGNTFGYEGGQFLFFNILSLPGAILILSFVLYPYVFVLCRTYFLQQSATFMEISSSLGNTPLKGFFRVVLPLARPAIAGGMILVLMEVLNDYGAVRYLGVDTFTIGIFSAWFSFGDAQAALKIAGLLLVMVFMLIMLERKLRGGARYDFLNTQFRPLTPRRLYGWKKWLALAGCAFPLFIGFVFPVMQLLYWFFEVAADIQYRQFFSLISNSFLLALTAAILCLAIALLLSFSTRINKGSLMRLFARWSTMGYAIPGAVIAVGVMIPFTWADRQIDSYLRNFFSIFGIQTGLILSGTLFALIFAYVVRFLAVGYNSIESGMSRISPNLEEASRSLGKRPSSTLWHVNLPLLRGALFSGAILVFIDVLKELPLTLILRPFNFDTLATKAFEFAIDERIAESAPASLVIIATGGVAVALLNRLIRKGSL